MWWVVDRLEGPYAILVNDAGSTVQLQRKGFREGRVYWWDGRRLRRSVAEERRRRRAAAGTLERLRARDPGGDIRL